MKTVGMKQLRQNFNPIRKGLEAGEEYLLMYRSKPLAVLRPYQATQDAKHLQNGHNPNVNNQESKIDHQNFNNHAQARKIAAPQTVYSDVINDYESRKADSRVEINSKPIIKKVIAESNRQSPIGEVQSGKKVIEPTPQTKNPLNRFGVRRAFV